MKDGAFSALWLTQADTATIFAGDALGNGDAETGALAHLFGSEKWLKDTVADLRGNAGAIIGDIDL